MPPNPRNEQIIAEFRAHEGTVAALSDGPPLLLLTTTDAKSTQPRIGGRLTKRKKSYAKATSLYA